MADRLTNIEAGIWHAIEPIFHALPQWVQDFAREVVDPESQANVAALRNAAKGWKPIGSQQDLQDIQNANKALMPHIWDSLNIQAKDTNPRLKDTVGDVNQLTRIRILSSGCQ